MQARISTHHWMRVLEILDYFAAGKILHSFWCKANSHVGIFHIDCHLTSWDKEDEHKHLRIRYPELLSQIFKNF